MQKAYDWVDWKFLDMMLGKMGFSNKWRSWIMTCVTLVKYNLNVNGNLSAQFNPSRGIRQDDPLSPYLFILVADVFSKLIEEAVQEKTLRAIKMNRFCPVISHMFFATTHYFSWRVLRMMQQRSKELLNFIVLHQVRRLICKGLSTIPTYMMSC